MKTYFNRISDAIIAEELAGMGAVLVQGAKWCGKTTSCEQRRNRRPYRHPQAMTPPLLLGHTVFSATTLVASAPGNVANLLRQGYGGQDVELLPM